MTGQLRTDINQAIESKLASLVARQNNFRRTNGHFCQWLWISNTIPADGAEVVNRGDFNPTDHAGAVAMHTALAIDALRLKGRIRVDVYEGPLGGGYTVKAQFRSAGQLYERTWNRGPETWRAANWAAAETAVDL